MKETTIIRTQKNKDNPYVMINKGIFENTSLSFKAKGIAGYILSRPDNWEINLRDLVNRSTEGKDAVRSGVKELEEHGYMVYRKERDEASRIIKHIWLFYETPQTPISGGSINGKPASGKTIIGLSTSGKTTSGKTTSGKPALTNNELSNKELNNNELNNIEDEEGNPFRIWESITGSLSQFIAGQIQDLIDDWQEWKDNYIDEAHPDFLLNASDVVCLAMETTATTAERPNIKYTVAVLDGWKKHGVGNKLEKKTTARRQAKTQAPKPVEKIKL